MGDNLSHHDHQALEGLTDFVLLLLWFNGLVSFETSR